MPARSDHRQPLVFLILPLRLCNPLLPVALRPSDARNRPTRAISDDARTLAARTRREVESRSGPRWRTEFGNFGGEFRERVGSLEYRRTRVRVRPAFGSFAEEESRYREWKKHVFRSDTEPEPKVSDNRAKQRAGEEGTILILRWLQLELVANSRYGFQNPADNGRNQIRCQSPFSPRAAIIYEGLSPVNVKTLGVARVLKRTCRSRSSLLIDPRRSALALRPLESDPGD